MSKVKLFSDTGKHLSGRLRFCQNKEGFMMDYLTAMTGELAMKYFAREEKKRYPWKTYQIDGEETIDILVHHDLMKIYVTAFKKTHSVMIDVIDYSRQPTKLIKKFMNTIAKNLKAKDSNYIIFYRG